MIPSRRQPSSRSGPAIRPFDEQRVLLDWIERAVDEILTDADGFDVGLLRSVFNGDITVSVRDAQPVFQLTEQGHERARNALMNDAEMRHFYQSLDGGAAVDEPKGKQ